MKNQLRTMIVYGRGLDENNKQLLNACRKLTGGVILAHAMDLSAYVGPNRSRFWHGYKEVRRVDLCFLRSLGSGSFEQVTKRLSLMEHLELSGSLVVNTAQAFKKARDKYLTMCILAKAGLPVPPTYVTEMAHWAYRASGGFKEIVYKPIVGSLGFGSMKFNNVDLAFNLYTQLERMGQPLYIQEYMKKLGRDVRAFVLGERVIAAIYRTVKASKWKTNVAQGAKAKPIQLVSKLEKIAVEAVKSLGLLYAGVDILENEKKVAILEVNGSPSWQGLQTATGVNVAEELVQYTVDYIKR